MAAEIPDPRPDLNDPIRKEQYFRSELNAFLDLALKVGQISHKTDIDYGVKKVEEILELAGPGYYKQILAHEKSNIKFMYVLLEKAFSSRRKSILKGLDDLSWTIQRGYSIQYGDVNDPKFKMIQIPIDTIFTLAKENLNSLEERVAGIKPEALSEDVIYELKHHILLLLHLMRMFFITSIGGDRITLAIMIRTLEDELNMVIGERCIPVSADLGNSPVGTGLAGGIGQAFGTISGLMRSIGINPSEGIRPPSESQLSSIIQGVFNNPTLQATVTSSMAGLQGSNNTTDVVAGIMGNIINGNVLQDITQATTSTVEQALSQSPTAPNPDGNLENTLKNFVTNVARTAGSQSPADLASIPVNITPGIAPGAIAGTFAGPSYPSSAATSSSAPSYPTSSSAPTYPSGPAPMVPAPLGAPQIVSSMPQQRMTTLSAPTQQ